MKKIFIGVAAALALAGGLTSCSDVLDVDPTSRYSESTAYASIDNLDLYVKYFYSTFHNCADIECTEYCITDDGVTDLLKSSWYNVSAGCINRFFYLNNFVTVESNFRSNWSTMYQRIRQVNEFLVDLHNGFLSGLDQDAVAIREGEARFIRAFAYQELVVRHGGVPLRINETKVDDDKENNRARSTEDECWDFILGEYDKAAAVLPLKWTGTEVGRLTKGAALGMKARAALYAKRYAVAQEACDELFDLGVYSLLPGTSVDAYNKIYTTTNNSELILPLYFEVQKKQHSWDTYMCPPGDATAYGYKGNFGGAVTPTEEYQQQFDIKVNGTWKSFDWNDLSSYTDGPYANRDPRFYASILYNDADWRGRKIQVWAGGTDEAMTFKPVSSQDNVHKTTTGYYIRKFLTTGTYNFTNTLSTQYWIEMRLAEIYLIRSEAYARQNQWSKAYEDLNTVRARVGLPALSQQTNWDSYLDDLQKERICELGLEGHRYNDIIRWGIATKVLNGQRVHGVKVTKNSNGTYSYTVIEADTQDRYFPERYTIFPIPYSEITSNALCEQNDLWK
jgi:hypothetical protein